MTRNPMGNALLDPGIRFETRPPVSVAVLPRMDIAAFVGFASSGPLHLPVPVEDLPRFRDIFGEDPVLAWDRERQSRQRALLGPCVDAFFRNGGRRCWVVRVANDTAECARFQLPELVSAGKRHPASLSARSPGTWAEALRVTPALDRESLQGVPGRTPAGGALLGGELDEPPLWLELPEHAHVREGDLLEAQWMDLGVFLWGFAEAPREAIAGFRVELTGQVWLEPMPALGSPADGQPEKLTEIHEGDALARLALAGARPKPTLSRLTLDLKVRHQTGPEGHPHPIDRGPFQPSYSGRIEWRLSDLAFDSRHPRFFGSLPDDSLLFRLSQGREDPPISPERARLLDEIANPARFPLAGMATEDRHWLPLDFPYRDRASSRGVWIEDEPTFVVGQARHDGLEPYLPSIFADPMLADIRSEALLSAAEHRYYLERQQLRGFHALLPVDEITLVALPDLTHRPWERHLPPVPETLAAPVLYGAAETDGEAGLHWAQVTGATRYQLQRADVLSPGGWLTLWQGVEKEVRAKLSKGCAVSDQFRVRALADNAPGPWSNTLVVPHQPVRFQDCAKPVLLPLKLQLEPPASPESERILVWVHLYQEPLPSDLSVQIQRSFAPSFESASWIDQGITSPPQQWLAVPVPTDAPAYYRARAGQGQPWSNTVLIHPGSRSDFALAPAEDVDWAAGIIRVQQALLRFCAARGDLFAVLSLPRGYRQPEAGHHLAALTTLGPAGSDEWRRTLSFGALYHPWVVSSSSRDDGELAAVPPDGLVLGMMAAQAAAEGAWIPPANLLLRGPLALEPALDATAERRLAMLRINPVTQRPRGFLTWGVATLSATGEVTDIQVRRLLILLRRLALREGNLLVFEPNSQTLRGRIRLIFERLLERLYQAGAFAGATPSEAYRVVVDQSVNPLQSLELGRLVVELRLLPALAVERIRVRLIQDGPESLAVEEP